MLQSTVYVRVHTNNSIMERWLGKVAVVTGASSGIGLTTAKQLVHHGLIVVGLARRINIMNEAMKNVKGPGKFYAKECDVTNEQNVIEIFNWIRSTFNSLHILVNNAAVLKLDKIEVCPTEDLESVFKVNVFGLLYCTKQAILLMKESQSEAHIININSVAGHNVPAVPNVFLNVYPASKFAVTALSQTLKNELTDSKIRVTNISPGVVETDMFEGLRKNYSIAKYLAMLSSEDVSNSIMFALSSPAHVEINEITLQAKHM